ncbi:MAG: helical backbone metal receptor [Flavobacteriales bacterium]|jgi:ABC-type Fe3+-hydroxamate transport system substrate-binding protein|nr:helical backbone metal receptor [Flavobacteriales bacterium]
MHFTDQLGRVIFLVKAPKRIISLVPSQTELLFDLGLADRVVGITKFCIHPNSWFESKQKVGGTKNLNFETIKKLSPDLIIANKEENNRNQIKRLMSDYPVWISDIGVLDDALKMISSIGELTQTSSKALSIVKNVEAEFSSLRPMLNMSVAYIIWKNPIMSVNKTRFIHDLLQRVGFRNVFAENNVNYPILTAKDLQIEKPDIILLSSEPFPFKDKHKEIFKEICPKAKVELVDGEFFSWYGSRLINSVDYFKKFVGKLLKIKH